MIRAMVIRSQFVLSLPLAESRITVNNSEYPVPFLA
jgi:hypothetical protein